MVGDFAEGATFPDWDRSRTTTRSWQVATLPLERAQPLLCLLECCLLECRLGEGIREARLWQELRIPTSQSLLKRVQIGERFVAISSRCPSLVTLWLEDCETSDFSGRFQHRKAELKGQKADGAQGSH